MTRLFFGASLAVFVGVAMLSFAGCGSADNGKDKMATGAMSGPTMGGEMMNGDKKMGGNEMGDSEMTKEKMTPEKK